MRYLKKNGQNVFKNILKNCLNESEKTDYLLKIKITLILSFNLVLDPNLNSNHMSVLKIF